jgi:Family of unknown function (DUF5989)
MLQSKIRLMLAPILTVAVIVGAIVVVSHRDKIIPFVYSLF